jgi:glycosyltransferase involved in cell wall biosynthesis
MKVALIARSTLFTVHGGSTVQIQQTANQLQELGVDAQVHLASDKIDYPSYDLFHFFDLTRPANILYHIKKMKKPFALTPILIDYSEYDKLYRKGFSGFVFGKLSPNTNEYIKSVSRWVLRKDTLPDKMYLFRGQTKSIKNVLQKAAMILPNSNAEYEQLNKTYGVCKPHAIIPNGINEKTFAYSNTTNREGNLVLCAARIEGIKNQLNLIKALNKTKFKLLIIGEPSQNQHNYYIYCKAIASENVEFIPKLSQEELVNYYQKAKVHVLPSWFETCGLSSLEAAAMGCNVVVSDKGFVREYFGDQAFYCDPENIESIYQMVAKASETVAGKDLEIRIRSSYTWKQAALKTLEAYQTILSQH